MRALSYGLAMLCAAAVAACSTGLPRGPGPAEASMAVSEDHFDLASELNRRLTALDWRLVPYTPESVTGADAALAERARYRLENISSRVGSCGAAVDLFAYHLRVIDNRSGDAVLTLKGSGCEGQVGDRFERYMRREGLQPAPR